MNYKKVYDSLIQKRLDNKLDKTVQGEIHHIKMKSIFPELANEKSNLVKLTYREHFIAHKLLFKIYKNSEFSSQVTWAFWRMCYCKKDDKYKINKSSRQFQREKEQAILIIGNSCTGKIRINNGVKIKMVLPLDLQQYLDNGYVVGGLPQTAESNRKRSIALKGKKHTKPSPLKGRPKSKEVRRKISLASKNRKHNYNTSEKTKKLLSKNAKGRIRINNGTKVKNVWPEELETYLQNGYQVGGLKASDATKQKMSKSHKGLPHNYTQVAWNKGLTKETDQRVRKYGETHARNNAANKL